jgi:DNA polymerase III delta subunit
MNTLFSSSGELLLRFVLLAGDDATSRELARAKIVASVKKLRPDAEVERFGGDDGDFFSFAERIITPSLLSSLRVFLVADVHLLKDKELEQLTALFKYDAPDALVVMETEKLKTGKTAKDVVLSKKYAAMLAGFDARSKKSPARFAIMEFPKPRDYEMAGWLATQTPHLIDRQITKEDAEYLIDLVGADMAVLNSELQKIDIFLDPGETINRKVIDTVAGATRQATQYELAQALGEKKMKRVLELIESMYSGSVYLPPFVGAIFRHFWTLFKIFQYTKANPASLRNYKSGGRQRQNDAALEIGIGAGIITEKQAGRLFPVMIKPRMVEQAISFKPGHYKKIFSLLSDFDIGLKTGRYDEAKSGFQVFCYRIVRGDV